MAPHAREIDWPRYDQLKAQGLSGRQIAEAMGVPESSLRWHLRKREGVPAVRHGTPATGRRYTQDHSGTPHDQPTQVHRSVPAAEPTAVHPGVPMPDDVAMRLLALLPDLEVMVAREHDRQRLLGTPISTPRHTLKKTYVVDTLYVDLIERYAKAEGVELKDVVNLAFHEFFERRQYLPEDRP
jgi:hypothetical protein